MAKRKRKPALVTIPLQEFESLMDNHKKQMHELQAELDACEELRERYDFLKEELVKWIETLKTTNDEIVKSGNALADLMNEDFYNKL